MNGSHNIGMRMTKVGIAHSTNCSIIKKYHKNFFLLEAKEFWKIEQEKLKPFGQQSVVKGICEPCGSPHSVWILIFYGFYGNYLSPCNNTA